MKKHILVTGGAGYIGSVLVGHLLNKGYQVTAIDALCRKSGLGLLAHCYNDNFAFYKRMVNTEVEENFAILGFDAVVHLASLLRPRSGFELEFKEINFLATEATFMAAAQSGAERFIFASTYFNYGLQSGVATEDSELNPFCPYTESKVEGEKYVLGAKDCTIAPIVLRFAQAYGLSPSMRWDLLVNRFVRDALDGPNGKRIVVFEKNVVRALVHVHDVCRAIEYALKAPLDKVAGEVFNVGSNDAHYTKDEIAKTVASVGVNRVEIEYSNRKTTNSMPSTEVCFDKIQNVLGWKPRSGLPYNVMDMMQANRELELL